MMKFKASWLGGVGVGLTLLAMPSVEAQQPTASPPPAPEDSVVMIRTANTLRSARGTGFIIGDGSWIATASHVVSADLGKGRRIFDKTVTVYSVWTGRAYEAKVVAADGIADIALLRLPEPGFPALPVEGFDRRDPTVALNNLKDRPLRLLGFPLSYGEDTVAALAKPEHNDSKLREIARRIEADKRETCLSVLNACPDVQPGWSGGPLISMDKGAVVAVFHSMYQANADAKEAYPAGSLSAYLGDLLKQAGATNLESFTTVRAPTIPRPADAAERLARELRSLSWNGVGNLKRAEEEQRGLVALAPQDGLAHAELGRLLLEQRQFDAAEKELREAVRLAPQSVFAQMYLGRALHLNYDPKGAQTALKAALDASPGEVEPQLVLAEVLEQNQKPDEAESVLRTAHEKAPEHPTVTFRLAKLLLATDRAPEGLKLMEEAYDLSRYDPGLGYVGLGYGRVLENNRKFKEAEAVYRQVQRLDPTNAQAFLALGGFYLRQRRIQDAQVTLSRGLDIPNLPPPLVEAFRNLQSQLAERAAGVVEKNDEKEDEEGNEKRKGKGKK